MVAALAALLLALLSALQAQPVSPQGQFVRGYEAAGGNLDQLGGALVMVYCESRWHPRDPGGVHVGVSQFSPDTWAKARRGPEADYRDPYEQGWATATWLRMIASPRSTAGWPGCWPAS